MSLDSKEELKSLKHIISSFSNFINESKKDIYTGDEKIPFKKRNEVYKKIFIYEFEYAIKQFQRYTKG